MSSPIIYECDFCNKTFFFRETLNKCLCPNCGEAFKSHRAPVERRLTTVGKSFTFEAAHYIPDHPLCGKVHGHTYKVDVELKGLIKDKMFVFDFKELSNIMKEILTTFDHTNLNDHALYIPTVENIAWNLYTILSNSLPHNLLIKVKVQEGEGGWAIAE